MSEDIAFNPNFHSQDFFSSSECLNYGKGSFCPKNIYLNLFGAANCEEEERDSLGSN